MGELYSVAGMFNNSFGLTPYGGYITRGIDGEEERIEGQLIDIWGPSRINGHMDDSSLKFTKRYDKNEDPLGNPIDPSKDLSYEFTLEGDLWRGRFSFPSGIAGNTICKTSLVLPDMDFRQVDLRSPEGYASAIRDSMVDSGMLEIITDPDGGEDRIRPV